MQRKMLANKSTRRYPKKPLSEEGVKLVVTLSTFFIFQSFWLLSLTVIVLSVRTATIYKVLLDKSVVYELLVPMS